MAKVLENLKIWKQIEPVRTYLIEEDYEITGLGVCCDGGMPAYGTSCYVMSQDPTTKKRDSKLASTKSRVRTIPAHEALARPLSMEDGFEEMPKLLKIFCQAQVQQAISIEIELS